MLALFAGRDGWEQRDTGVPRLQPTQVLVRARAVSVNNADLESLVTEPTDPDASPLGYEFAGEVVAVGAAVRGIGCGDRVMGTTPGSFAQFIAVDHRHVVPTPDGLRDEDASALPTGLLTEHGSLQLADFTAGQSVLITGATSGIGLLGVQLAHLLGASQVIATTRSDAAVKPLLGLGADEVVVTSSADLGYAVLSATHGAGVDVVLDHVGGSTLAACLGATAVGGTVVNVGRLADDHATIDLSTAASRQLTLRAVSFGFTPVEQIAHALSGLRSIVLPAVADGRVHAVVNRILEFGQVNDALTPAGTSGPGKTVLRVP